MHPCLDATRHVQALTGEDPDRDPARLPPRTRADVVQDRPAGGTPSEVAESNPGLAAAIPATVGQSGANQRPAVTASEAVALEGMEMPELAVLPSK